MDYARLRNAFDRLYDRYDRRYLQTDPLQFVRRFREPADQEVIGLLASSLTSNQVVAAIVGFGTLLILTLIGQATSVTSGTTAVILEQLSLTGHFTDFARGIIDTNNIVYFISVTAVFLFLTVRNVESRRWR